MKTFAVLRFGMDREARIEKEDLVQADYFGVHDGVLTFYRNTARMQAPEVIATYGTAAWIKVTERREQP